MLISDPELSESGGGAVRPPSWVGDRQVQPKESGRVRRRHGHCTSDMGLLGEVAGSQWLQPGV